MAKNHPAYLGVDLGGTNIQCGLLDADGQLLARDDTKTKADQGSDAVIGRIGKLVEQVIEKANVPREHIGGLGIGAPGAVNPHKGTVITAVNLRWTDFPLAKALEKEVKMPVIVDNDVNVGAWGEHQAGAAKGHDSLLAVFVGTGIGGGLILNSQLFHGHYFTGGEIGHVIMESGGTFGRRTLENLASRANIANQIIASIRSNHPSQISELVEGDLTRVRSKVIAQAYRDKDVLTVRVVNEAARVIGHAIANAVTLLSLPCVVLGGGLTEALGQPLVREITRSFEDGVFPKTLTQCKIIAGTLGDDAGLTGAALLARKQLA